MTYHGVIRKKAMEEKKRLMRSDHGMIAGVCAGLADYFGVDPTIVRVLFVLLILFGGGGGLLYIILWIVMPKQKNA